MPYKLPNPPKVRIRDILKFLQKDSPKEGEYFTTDTISHHFNITMSDAGVRIIKMRSYGWVKFYDKSVRPYKYELTDYGRRFE